MNEPNPIQKHIILNKLIALRDSAPDPFHQDSRDTYIVARQWLSNIRALLNRYDPLSLSITLNTRIDLFSYDYGNRFHTINFARGSIGDTIQKITLDLELDGRTDIGTAYSPGEVYRYFADLKQVISGAKKEIVLVDPYLDGETFDACFSNCPTGVTILILTVRYVEDVAAYAAKHRRQFETSIEIRKSDELHDRLIIIDREDCWISGGSIKDGGNKATYLVPLTPPIPEAKIRVYGDIWKRASK